MSSAATRRRVLPATSRGRTSARSALAWAAERSFFAPPGISSSSRWCSWDDDAGVVLTQGPAPVDQDPQHRELFVVDDRTQSGHPDPDQRDGVGVGGVGLAALTGREDPGPRRQLRWHVDDLLAGSQQPHRDVMADPVAALDRPHPVLGDRPELVDVIDHRGEPGLIGAEPATARSRSRRRSSPRS